MEYNVQDITSNRRDILNGQIKNQKRGTDPDQPNSKGGPCIIEAEVTKADNVFPMIPAGAPVSEMLIDEPHETRKLKKPEGST